MWVQRVSMDDPWLLTLEISVYPIGLVSWLWRLWVFHDSIPPGKSHEIPELAMVFQFIFFIDSTPGNVHLWDRFILYVSICFLQIVHYLLKDLVNLVIDVDHDFGSVHFFPRFANEIFDGWSLEDTMYLDVHVVTWMHEFKRMTRNTILPHNPCMDQSKYKSHSTTMKTAHTSSYGQSW